MNARDRAVLERQLGRPPRAARRVVVRCPWGEPAVTEQSPYDVSGTPFPTTFYLTCPALVAAVSRLEASGGVERWSALVEEDAELAASLDAATEDQRQLRSTLAAGQSGPDGGTSLALGIGGASSTRQLKCLHAHVAFALARPPYVLGDRIVADVGQLFPGDGCCLDRPLPSTG